MKKYKILCVLIFIVIAVVIYIGADAMPSGIRFTIGAGDWPKILSICLALLSVILFIQTMQKEKEKRKTVVFDIHSASFRRVLKGVGVLAIFGILLYFFGFFIGAFFMIPATMLLMGEKDIRLLAGVTIGVEAFTFVVFSIILKLSLPTGVLF